MGPQQLLIPLVLCLALIATTRTFGTGSRIAPESNDVHVVEADDEKRPVVGMNSTALPIAHIYLLGERNSGTNYNEHLVLNRAFPKYGNPSKTPFSSTIPVLGFKHMFRHGPLNVTELRELRSKSTDGLYLMMVRNPCDWADGMWRKPWHLCPPDQPQRCPGGPYIGVDQTLSKRIQRQDFFQMNWNDWPESIHSKDYSYDTIFELRRAKLKLMDQVMLLLGPKRVKIVQMHTLERDPERFIQELAKQYDLSISPKHTAMSPSNKTHPTRCLSREEHALVKKLVDWEMERKYGFEISDCRVCAEA